MNETSHDLRERTPGSGTIKEIMADLAKKLPERVLEHKTKGGQRLTFIPWHRAVKIMDHYAPGWCYEVRNIYRTADRIFVVCRVTIPTADGIIYREATGTETLDTDSWGDPSSNAESMALRRACAKFGLGLYLYEG